MYHSFFIHSFTYGRLSCFQHLAIVNCAAKNSGVHRFFWIGDSGFLGYNPSSGIEKEGAYTLATAWMELESIMLSEISQVVKDKYHMVSPLTGT